MDSTAILRKGCADIPIIGMTPTNGRFLQEQRQLPTQVSDTVEQFELEEQDRIHSYPSRVRVGRSSVGEDD